MIITISILRWRNIMANIVDIDDCSETLYYCPYCSTTTSNTVTKFATIKFGHSMEDLYFKVFYILDCNTCGKHSILVEKEKPSNNNNTEIQSIDKQNSNVSILSQKFIYPVDNTSRLVPPASDSMPKDVRSMYNEAASVFELSPRSSAALIRLTLETLLKKHLVNDGKDHNLNTMIGMSNMEQPELVTEFMDMIRKEGNEEVHPEYEKLEHEWGDITKDTNKDQVLYMFNYINSICDLLGVVDKMHNDYEDLPESQKRAIRKRNAKYNVK